MDISVRILRADLTLLENYRYVPDSGDRPLLSCSTTCFDGSNDLHNSKSTDDQLNDMEKDLANILTDDQQQDSSDEDKIPESLLKDLESSQDNGQWATSDKSDDKIPESLLEDLKADQDDGHHAKPLDESDDLLSDDDVRQKQKRLFEILSQNDADKIPESLLEELKADQDNGHHAKPLDKSVLQGFVTDEKPNNDGLDSKPKVDLLSDDDVRQKQKRLFEILTRKELEDTPKSPELSSPDALQDDKIPEDLLRDLESEPKDDNVKKEILTSILMDELVNKIKTKNKRGERIPDKVIDLLRKYNAKRFVAKTVKL